MVQTMLQVNLLTLRGDAYLLLVSANRIDETRSFMTATAYGLDKFPLLQISSLVISKISSVTLYDVALYSPKLYQILAVLLIYLFARELYDTRSALLASTLFAYYFIFIEINSFFRPESLGFVFMFATLWVLFRRAKSSTSLLSLTVLAIIFMLSITLTHYTTNGIIIFLLGVNIIAHALLRFLYSKNLVRVEPYSSISGVFFILASVMVFGYWMYVGQTVLLALAVGLQDIAQSTMPSAQQLGQVTRVPLLKETIIWRTHVFYVFLFMALMFYEIFKRRQCKDYYVDVTLAFWVASTFILWLILEQHSQLLSSNRIYIFSYPFVLIFVSHIVTKLRYIRIRTLLLFLLVGFVLVNVLTIQFIPLNPLSRSTPFPLSNWDTTQDLQAARWESIDIGSSRVVVSGAMGSLLKYTKVLHKRQINNNIDVFDTNMEGLRKDSRWLYIKPDQPSFIRQSKYSQASIKLNEETLFRILDTPWLQKLYTNGEWEIYSITP
ncbi:hypothetical protein ACFLWB_00050 [Chloroflexota bacterium]